MVAVEHFVDDCITCSSGSTHTLITNTLVYIECDDCKHFILICRDFEPLIGIVHPEWKKGKNLL